MTSRVFTASWTALWHASKHGDLPLAPVRISRGGPRFWPAASKFPAIPELMPDGWMLDAERGKAERGYRGKLDRVGIDVIIARLDEITQESGGQPLALACFEKVGEGKPCHRWWFAVWFEAQTGRRLPEIGSHASQSGGEGQQTLDLPGQNDDDGLLAG